jgi:hypothetical protein
MPLGVVLLGGDARWLNIRFTAGTRAWPGGRRLRHRIAAWGDRPHTRWFVQYADGTQLDLVATPVSKNA